jgi:hypothetical protein
MSDIRKQIVELAGGDEDLLFADPPETFDSAIVGVGRRYHDTFVAYDQDKVLANLAESFGADGDPDQDPETDALEWFEYNTVGGWIGEKTAVFVRFLDRQEDRMADENRTVMSVFLEYQRTVMDALAAMREELLEIEHDRAEREHEEVTHES